MNKNHYDAGQVCNVKIRRIKSIIERIQDAENILEQIPHEMIQTAWNGVVDRMEKIKPAGQGKTKPISKGVYRRSMRKTLQCLKVQQQNALNEIQKRLKEAVADSQKRQQLLMEQMKNYIAQQLVLLG